MAPYDNPFRNYDDQFGTFAEEDRARRHAESIGVPYDPVREGTAPDPGPRPWERHPRLANFTHNPTHTTAQDGGKQVWWRPLGHGSACVCYSCVDASAVLYRR